MFETIWLLKLKSMVPMAFSQRTATETRMNRILNCMINKSLYLLKFCRCALTSAQFSVFDI